MIIVCIKITAKVGLYVAFARINKLTITKRGLHRHFAFNTESFFVITLALCCDKQYKTYHDKLYIVNIEFSIVLTCMFRYVLRVCTICTK